jgi:lysozyme
MSTWRQKNIWQLVNDDGSLTTGWVSINGYWYYMDETGTMYEERWLNHNDKWYYLEYGGHMVTGWKKIDNKYYCFAADGSLYVNCKTPDGYEVDSNGVWKDSLISEKCLQFIKDYEDFYAYKYDDGRGVITQGYGCTGDEIADWPDNVSEEFASTRCKDIVNKKYAKPIKSDLDSKGVKLERYQFDALVSCAYNIGVGDSGSGLLGSTLYRYVVGGGRDPETVTKYFRMWNKVIQNGVAKVWDGLDIRRKAEANIFNNSIYDSTH